MVSTVTVLLIIGLIQNNVLVVFGNLVVSGKSAEGPVEYGTQSSGFVGVLPGGTLSQACLTGRCGQIDESIMSGLYVHDEGKLTQDPGSQLISGNYTVFTLDHGCEINMLSDAQIRPNIRAGGGRIEVYCSAPFNVHTGSYISLSKQSQIIVKGDFVVGAAVLVEMEPASTLNIMNPLTIEDVVRLHLKQNSRFIINPNSGAVATITSSKHHTATTLVLEDSATIIVNGTFTLGEGRQVTMAVKSSGSLVITTRGEFQVQASSFDIGPSSYWFINGSFNLDSSSVFETGMQSNLTIHGDIKTKSGILKVGPFSSFVVEGTCNNEGNLTTSEFSKLKLGPQEINGTGVLMLQNAGVVALDVRASFSVLGNLQTERSSLTIGERATVTVGKTGQILQSGGSSVILNKGASLSVSGEYHATNCSMQVGLQASVTISNNLVQDGGAHIELSSKAVVVFQSRNVNANDNSRTEIRKSGSLTVHRGARLTAGPVLILGASIVVHNQSMGSIYGRLTAYADSKITIGRYSSFTFPEDSVLEVPPFQQVKIGERSQVTFDSNLICVAERGFAVQNYQKLHVTAGKIGGMMCKHISE